MKTAGKLIGVPVTLLLLLLSPQFAAAADDTAPSQILRTEGLTLIGQKYLLPDDVKLADWLRQVRALERKVSDATKRRSNLQRDIDQMEANGNNLYSNWLDEKDKLSRMDKRVPYAYNQQVDRVNALRTKILAVIDAVKQRAAVLGTIEDSSDDYVALTVQFGAALDAMIAKYQALADDQDTKAAIAAVNQKSGTNYLLGPSDRLQTELADIRKMIARVNSDTIKFEFEGGVPTVPVILNGKEEVHAIVDSGAATVSISERVAKKIGLKPGPNDRTVQMVTADGSISQVHLMLLKSVRLGKFTVQDVECTVVPDNGKDVDTLLGGTFLRRFVYRMDLAAGQLKLSQIGNAITPEPPAATNGQSGPEHPIVRQAPDSSPRPAISSNPSGKITILKANYGRGDNWVDVTAMLRVVIANDPYIPLAADDSVLGSHDDPAAGQAKSLMVTYMVGDQQHEVTVDQNQIRLLQDRPVNGVPDASAPVDLKITQARYGIGIHWINVTALVKQKATDPIVPFDLTTDEIGVDPMPDHSKRLVVWFSYRGRDYATVAVEHFGLHNVRLMK